MPQSPGTPGKLPMIRKIGFQLALFATCAILIVGSVSVLYMSASNRNVINQIDTERSQMALTTMNSMIKDYETQSAAAAEHLAANAEVIHAVQLGDAAAVKTAVSQSMKQMATDVDFVTVVNGQGVVIARTLDDKTGDSVTGQANVAKALKGETATVTETGADIKLAIRTGSPVKDSSGKIIGAISTGYSLVNTEFVDKMKSMTGSEFTILWGTSVSIPRSSATASAPSAQSWIRKSPKPYSTKSRSISARPIFWAFPTRPPISQLWIPIIRRSVFISPVFLWRNPTRQCATPR